MTTSHLQNRVVIVTGAGSGFGRILCVEAAARGAKVVGADVNADGLAETSDLAGGITTAVTDVTNRAQMQALAATAVETHGAIDVMINNAGVMPLAFFADHAEAADAWDRCIDINFKGVINGITAVHDQMMGQGRGHVVNVASIYGNQPVVGSAVYGATKAAVAFVSDALRQEARGVIKVTVVRPTGIPTTGLASGIVNRAAAVGIMGQNMAAYGEAAAAVSSENPPAELIDPDSPQYVRMAPELLAEQILYAVDQPWGVTISDVTVRATGDYFVI